MLSRRLEDVALRLTEARLAKRVQPQPRHSEIAERILRMLNLDRLPLMPKRARPSASNRIRMNVAHDHHAARAVSLAEARPCTQAHTRRRTRKS